MGGESARARSVLVTGKYDSTASLSQFSIFYPYSYTLISDVGCLLHSRVLNPRCSCEIHHHSRRAQLELMHASVCSRALHHRNQFLMLLDR